MGVERREKLLGWVTRGEECESDGGTLVLELQDGVGVTFRQHRFVMVENGRREAGKIARVGYARRGIGM